jgi:small subunit ribosomal protein S20
LANIASSIKRARQAEKRRSLNHSQNSRLRTHVKRVLNAVREGDKEKAAAAYKSAVSVIDSSVGKGFLHRNTAARRKSHLNAKIKAM